MFERLRGTPLSATPFQQHVWFMRAAKQAKETGCVCGLGISYNTIIVIKINTMVYDYCCSSMFIAEQNHLRPHSKPVDSTDFAAGPRTLSDQTSSLTDLLCPACSRSLDFLPAIAVV